MLSDVSCADECRKTDVRNVSVPKSNRYDVLWTDDFRPLAKQSVNSRGNYKGVVQVMVPLSGNARNSLWVLTSLERLRAINFLLHFEQFLFLSVNRRVSRKKSAKKYFGVMWTLGSEARLVPKFCATPKFIKYCSKSIIFLWLIFSLWHLCKLFDILARIERREVDQTYSGFNDKKWYNRQILVQVQHRFFFFKLNFAIKSAVSHQLYTKTSTVTAACIENVLKVHFTPFRGVLCILLAIIQHFKQPRGRLSRSEYY